jgi:DNA topoisomerase-1
MPRKAKPLDPFIAPADAARAGGLRHVRDDRPGITRLRAGKGFRYLQPTGDSVEDEETLERIRRLAIPPAWTEVWICPSSAGHLQATGRDARGRKQYRYHARWREVRDETKYGRMREFGLALPRIRAQVDRDLARPGIPRERALATIVHLLEESLIRIGSPEYARDNDSYGLTTLTNRHVQVTGNAVRFRFRGKSGKAHAVTVRNRRLAALVRRIRELPGQELFQYLDADGTPVPITSADVNAYLREVTGQEFSAKDFRTWAGSLLAAKELPMPDAATEAAVPRSLQVAAVAAVAERLGNTPAVCRKCYIHPAVLEAFEQPARLAAWHALRKKSRARKGLASEEVALLQFLEAPLARAA